MIALLGAGLAELVAGGRSRLMTERERKVIDAAKALMRLPGWGGPLAALVPGYAASAFMDLDAALQALAFEEAEMKV